LNTGFLKNWKQKWKVTTLKTMTDPFLKFYDIKHLWRLTEMILPVSGNSFYVKEHGVAYQYRYKRRLFRGIGKRAHAPSFRWLKKCKGCSTATNHQMRPSLHPNNNNNNNTHSDMASIESQTQPTIAEHSIPVGSYCLLARTTK
jgi:hypothetical protein